MEKSVDFLCQTLTEIAFILVKHFPGQLSRLDVFNWENSKKLQSVFLGKTQLCETVEFHERFYWPESCYSLGLNSSLTLTSAQKYKLDKKLQLLLSLNAKIDTNN